MKEELKSLHTDKQLLAIIAKMASLKKITLEIYVKHGVDVV